MTEEIGNKLVEPMCYLSMFALTALTQTTDIVPLHLNITVFSLAIIIIGSNRSMKEMVVEMKKYLTTGKKSEDSAIETLSHKDALQFPVYAGIMLVGLYALIKFFGKEAVNYFILVYIAVGGTTGIKALLSSFTGGALDKLDESKLIDIKYKTWIDLQISPLDFVCFLLSCVQVGIYVYTKSWIYNNILAIIFCVHALQFIFLGNFKNGALLLILLFFYDIFFVFGTDVMITVAKNIDAPIKLQFPRDLTVDPPQYSILGLGDIVLPGIFMSLCLRFDFLKTVNVKELNDLSESERKGKGEVNQTVKYLIQKANSASKTYFLAVIVGYLIAIVTTVVIMIIFQHGQPALLYLVPGCILSVVITAYIKGELKLVTEYSEDIFLGKEEDKKDQ